jgi:hypothetical protein
VSQRHAGEQSHEGSDPEPDADLGDREHDDAGELQRAQREEDAVAGGLTGARPRDHTAVRCDIAMLAF